MCSWYDLETLMVEHHKDLLREADAKKRARMVQGQHHGSGSFLHTLIRLGDRAIAWGARVYERKTGVRVQVSDYQSLRGTSGR